MPETPKDTAPPKRLTEITKCVPVLFVIAVISVLLLTYVFCHCFPLMQLHHVSTPIDEEMRARGTNQFLAFALLSPMLIICYIRSILVSPGEIPDSKEWQYYGESPEETGVEEKNINISERKKSGERRHCKWCSKYKPDRCHHCRVCRTCILKMDHHCPWIYNCVGYRNQKFFFLLLFYTMLCTQLIVWTQVESVKRVVDADADFMEMFTLVFAETLCAFLAVLVVAFFGFHIWLMFNAMTTIEFCEKSSKKFSSTSAYHRGTLGDMKEVLGANVLLWLIPCFDLTRDGLSFVDEGTLLTCNTEVGSQIKSTHPRRSRATDETRKDDVKGGGDSALPAPSGAL